MSVTNPLSWQKRQQRKTLGSLLMKSFTLSLLLAGANIAHAGTWTPLNHQPTFLNPASLCAQFPNANCVPPGYVAFGGAFTPTLMTDGSVLVLGAAINDDGHGYFNSYFLEYKLTPDIYGSYINGTWTQVASIPNAASSTNPNCQVANPDPNLCWGPFGNLASAVLPDGRVIYEGGELNSDGLTFLSDTFSNTGAIYDPVLNQWTSVAPPPFFVDLSPTRTVFAPNPIGDSQSVVLPNGTFMLADKMSAQSALLNAKTLTWTPIGSGKADLNDEEGWTLLPNGKVLAVDTYVGYGPNLAEPSAEHVPPFPDNFFGAYPSNPTHSEVFDPATGSWSSAGSTIVSLTDPITYEMGPAVLMPNGVVLAMGSTGNSALYNSYTGKWSVGPTLPTINGIQQVALDTDAVLLPNGNILISTNTSPNPLQNLFESPPLSFFEFDGKNFIPEPTIPDSALVGGVSMLVLPTGQILETDTDTDVEIYTSSKPKFPILYAPIILSAPDKVSAGNTYTLNGILLNGVSQAAMEGDDEQVATNFPLVRITNLLTGHVFYSRTHDFSSMAVASLLPVSTKFDVPANQEKGPSLLEVVTNGIPTLIPRIVNVK